MSRDADEKRPEAVTKAAGLACALLGDGTCESIHANIFRVGSEYQGSDMHGLAGEEEGEEDDTGFAFEVPCSALDNNF